MCGRSGSRAAENVGRPLFLHVFYRALIAPRYPVIPGPYKQTRDAGALVEWASDAEWPAVENVRVDHRRGHVAVPQ
jgi:hypothetical protein